MGLSSVSREGRGERWEKVSLGKNKGTSNGGSRMNLRRRGIRCIQQYARGPADEKAP